MKFLTKTKEKNSFRRERSASWASKFSNPCVFTRLSFSVLPPPSRCVVFVRVKLKKGYRDHTRRRGLVPNSVQVTPCDPPHATPRPSSGGTKGTPTHTHARSERGGHSFLFSNKFHSDAAAPLCLGYLHVSSTCDAAAVSTAGDVERAYFHPHPPPTPVQESHCRRGVTTTRILHRPVSECARHANANANAHSRADSTPAGQQHFLGPSESRALAWSRLVRRWMKK